jgi:hypothetical protein
MPLSQQPEHIVSATLCSPLNGGRSSPVRFAARICRQILAEQSNYFKVELLQLPAKKNFAEPERAGGGVSRGVMARAIPK